MKVIIRDYLKPITSIIITGILGYIALHYGDTNTGLLLIVLGALVSVFFLYLSVRDTNFKDKWNDFYIEYKNVAAPYDMRIMDGEEYSNHVQNLHNRFNEREIKILLTKGFLTDANYNLSVKHKRNVDEYKKIYDSYYEDCRVNNELYPKRINNQYFDYYRFNDYKEYLKEHIINNKLFEKETPVDYKFYLNDFRINGHKKEDEHN